MGVGWGCPAIVCWCYELLNVMKGHVDLLFVVIPYQAVHYQHIGFYFAVTIETYHTQAPRPYSVIGIFFFNSRA